MALMISWATTPPTTAQTGLSSPNNKPEKMSSEERFHDKDDLT